MTVVPGDIETTHQPPMSVPLRHFVVGLGFLLSGALVGVYVLSGAAFASATLAHAHLLLAGWICLTIMGAMTQFVPVWSGVRLHSRRLSTIQLWLVTLGLLGFAAALFGGRLTLVPLFGGVMLFGFWTFVYNLGRTLRTQDSYDVTERHFGFALVFFVLVTTLGFLLAVDFALPVFSVRTVPRANVIRAHATLAVFGAVVTTILGALYQLATMFTQTRLHGTGVLIRRTEEVGYPVGVILLATGRLFGASLLARVGGAVIVVSLLGFSVVLARRLYETRVDWTPMLSRYALVVPAMALWAALTLPVWLTEPLARTTLFGAPGTVHLLVLGVVGFTVFGTLYHVVPFIVWVHRYSDLLGYEAVPMIDDLYDDRVAATDFVLASVGTGVLVATDLRILPSTTGAVAGGVLVALGSLLFAGNILWVVRAHSPYSIRGILFETFRVDPDSPVDDPTESADSG